MGVHQGSDHLNGTTKHAVNGESKSSHPTNPQFTFIDTTFTPSSFWDRRRRVAQKSTLPTQLDMLRKTGRYDAFDLKWHPSYSNPPTIWPVPNHLFWDSDVAKWIEGACYFLATEKRQGREHDDIVKTVNDLVQKIRKAQQPDGYLNIHFTVVEPEKRFSNLRDLHELYNAGHLIEAAIIHAQHFGNDDLMEPLIKYVELFHKTFGVEENQIRGYPGHPEIELALLRLYRATGNNKSLELARYFLEERGNPYGVDGKHYYDVEAKKRGEGEHVQPAYYPARRSYWYHQAHKPIVDQETIEGHSVRAMYLLTSVADLSTIDKQGFGTKYREALERLWTNMVDRKMYLTGGIGAIKQWEGFGIDYFLPQGTDEGGCYSETCAAIGVMMLAERMLQLDLDAKYADILELCLYNAFLTGMSQDGKGFTYVNQLASSPGNLSKREEWFECACCPPNVARTLGYLGGYFWTWKETDSSKKAVEINVHLYASAALEFEVEGVKVQLTQRTNWPWSGDVDFELTTSDDIDVTVRLRIPQWAKDHKITPSASNLSPSKGYITLDPAYLATNRTFHISVPMKPRLIRPHPYTNQPIAGVARGPIIYCVEDADNTWVTDHFKSVVFNTSVPLQELEVTIAGREGVEKETYVAISAEKAAVFMKDAGPFTNDTSGAGGLKLRVDRDHREDLRFIPYYARANRGGKGMMRVGLRVGPFEEV